MTAKIKDFELPQEYENCEYVDKAALKCNYAVIKKVQGAKDYSIAASIKKVFTIT
jgi:hypothetical protein